MAPRLRHVAARSRRRDRQVSRASGRSPASPPEGVARPGSTPGPGRADDPVDDVLEGSGDDTVVVRVHAQPGAKRTEIAGRHGEAVRVRVTAPPVDGRANAAIAAVLADALGVPRSAVELASGASGRRKRFRVHGTTRAAVSRALAAVLDG